MPEGGGAGLLLSTLTTLGMDTEHAAVGDFGFTIQGSTLIRCLRNALLFASKDDTLPYLTAVRIDLDGGEVVFRATDLYALSRETAEVISGPGGSGGFWLSRRDAETLAALRSWNTESLPVSVAFAAVTGAASTVTFDAGPELGVRSFLALEDEDPGFLAMNDRLEGSPVTKVALNQKHLAALARVRPEKKQRSELVPVVMTMCGDGRKPVKIQIGERFSGVLGTVRLAESSNLAQTPAA